MKKIQYTTRTGKKQYKPVLSEKAAFHACDESQGFCLACGKYGQPAEPDAERYTCESCGLPKVYGIGQLAILGLICIK